MRRSSRSSSASSSTTPSSNYAKSLQEEAEQQQQQKHQNKHQKEEQQQNSQPLPLLPPSQSLPPKQPLSLTNDVLNKLGMEERQKVIALVTSLRGGQISKDTFLQTCQSLMNENLFYILQTGINSMPSTHAPVPAPTVVNITAEEKSSYSSNATNSQTQRKQQTAAAANNSSAQDDHDFDVNRLEDVMQYTGVDLKAEDEIGLEQRNQIHINHHHSMSNAPISTTNTSLRYDSTFNGARMKALISASVLPKGITDMGEDCLDIIALALRRRLVQVIEDLVQASKHRVDHGRASWKIRIENDPRKQVWLLEQFSKRMDDSVRAGKGIYGPMMGGPNPSTHGHYGSLLSSRTASPPPIKTAPYHGMSAAAIHQAAKIAKTASTSTSTNTTTTTATSSSSNTYHSAAGLDIKTKIANSTAAQATGLELKSWMTDPNILKAAAAAAASSSSNAVGRGGECGDSSFSANSSSSSFASAPSLTPINDRDLVNLLNNRSISLSDLIFVSENDPHLKGSTFLLSLYNHQNAK